VTTVTQPKRPRTRRTPARRPAGGVLWTTIYFTVAVLAIAGIVAAVTLGRRGDTTALAAGKPIDGMTCGQMEGQVQHVHQYLEFVIDGRYYLPPESVGIVMDKARPQTVNCMYWAHTHTPDGVIHVESPTKETLTLGHLLDVWSVSSVSRMLLERTQAGPPARVIVDGKEYTGDLRAIPLRSHAMITIEYGATLMPQRAYDFQKAGLQS
jgi:hypothetical protein